jgi:PIN domain nuclease of toxin-antitoxin system
LSTNSFENGAPIAGSSFVLDSSALLALILEEPGGDVVMAAVRDNASISAVNLSEVVTRLVRQNWTEAEIRESIGRFELRVDETPELVAWDAGLMSRVTSAFGLSLGDRYCLALARHLGLPVLTADRVWSQLDLGVEVVVCR